jgi:hypothetical protein
MTKLDNLEFKTEQEKERWMGIRAINLLRQNCGCDPLPGTRYILTDEGFKRFISSNSRLALILKGLTFEPNDASSKSQDKIF